MKKLDLLRAHLLATVPGLAVAPERLMIHIEDGIIRFRAADSLSHELRTPVRITILDYTGPMDQLTVPLCAWLAHYQPDMLPDAIRFQAEMLSTQQWDLSLLVPLTERITVEYDAAQGRFQTTHHAPEFPREYLAGTPYAELWSKGELLSDVGAD